MSVQQAGPPAILLPESAPVLRFGTDEFQDIYAWLVDEAETLDQRRYRDWMRSVTRDIVYRASVRATVAHSLNESLRPDVHLFHEDYFSLSKRTERLETEHAWAEDPPSRTRRFVTNIRVYQGPSSDLYVARSYVLLYRSRGDMAAELVSAERRDLFRRTPEGLRLAERVVAVDDAVLRTQNLTFIL